VTQILLLFVPFLLAVLTGVAIVGREVERGTARLAWSLAPSRATWFAGRLLPVLVVVAAIGLLSGLAADRLSVSMTPGTTPWASLLDYGNRGVDLAARVAFAFAVAVLIGAALGRALPALLVATIVVFVGLGGGSSVHGRILASEAVPVVSGTNYYDPANLTFDTGFLAPDGQFISYDAMLQRYPQPTDPNVPWNPPYPQAQRIVPGTRYPLVVGREVAALLAGATAAVALAFLLVRRARPG
jgi:ABC-type transport system involved in multi-copper enzyme maturation permease subunit